MFLVAPATANTVGKIAAGIDDTPVTTCATTALRACIPTVVAPVMHEPMYDHPAIPETLETLAAWGVETVDPHIEEGKAKIATEAAIVTGTARVAGEQPLTGETVVVTAGGTTEKVDPVRALTDRASGKTGRAVARACHVHGATVRLVHSDMLGDPPDTHYAEPTWIESVAELQEATVDAAFVVANTASVMGENRTRTLLVDAADDDSYEGEKSGLGQTVAEKLAAACSD